MKTRFHLVACLASIAVGAGSAQAAVAPDRTVVAPTGVGRCMFDGLPAKLKQDVLATYIAHHDITEVPGFRDAVGRVARVCTGRPNAGHEPAVVGTTVSVFYRLGAGYELNKATRLTQGALDDAWAASSPDERRPFETVAQSFLDPGPIAQVDAVAAVAPFARRLGISPTPSNQLEVGRALWTYFYATALRDMAEARLAAIKPAS
jgi:hypothetical protein